MTTDDMIRDVADLAEMWRTEANDLKRNGLPESASTLYQCRTEMLAMVKRWKREVSDER